MHHLGDFLGKDVMVICLSYVYAGELIEIGDEFIALNKAKIVLETGPFDKAGYGEAYDLPEGKALINIGTIEVICLGK